MKKIYFSGILSFLVFLSTLAQTQEVTITPTSDNTIFQNTDLSNGLGQFIFTGVNNQNQIRRALVKFTLSNDIPDGVSVDSARLILSNVKMKPSSSSLDMYFVTSQWGEGSSSADDGKGAPAEVGDATWNHALYNTVPWVKKGGDFAVEKSATASVIPGENAVLNSERMVVDVNFWLQNPTENFGWILRGDESGQATSVKFGSKDNNDPELWPRLVLYYEGATAVRDFDLKQTQLSVYQGSAANILRIRNTGDPLSGTLTIYSVTGSRLFSEQLEIAAGERTLETSIHQEGIYIYQIHADGFQTSGKLLIQKR
jgi:hypothetical protein